jgi:oxygen-independent coproporphyrinogen-3 oxidase
LKGTILTVTLINTPYKYEIEAILKIFFPLRRFKFCRETIDTSEDFVFIETEDQTQIKIGFDGKHFEKTFGGTSEEIVCLELYKALRDLTGTASPWGIMTGIRPVKRVNDLFAAGKTRAEIKKILCETALLSDEKAELALGTAAVQQRILKPFDKKSFSLYVGIPFCPSRCSYCSFVSHSVKSPSAKKLMSPYADRLCEELDEIAAIAYENGLILQNIYVGGGTPTALFPADLEKILSKIAEKFDILGANEYTVEAGRPDTISPEKLGILKRQGVSRISINPQTTRDSVLAAIGRNHTAEDFFKAFAMAREAGFANINTDLIAGLPTDTAEGFIKTLDRITTLDPVPPESITVHTLTLKRSSSLFGQYEGGDARDSESQSVNKMVNYAEEVLPAAGWSPYYLYRQKNTVGNLENVGFAKKDFESLYNVYIMEETQTILSAGSGGSTKLVSESGRIERVFNYKYPYEYISGFSEIIKRKDIVRKFYEEELLL